MTRVARFRQLHRVVLAFTVAVILWGAYVRASGSGAGCGSHWPTCNGEIIPRPKTLATLIEVLHRLTSGALVLGVTALLVGAFRAFPRRSSVRRAAAVVVLFIVTEALVGAGLVLFEMVAGNKSVARAAWMAVHLLNTFALLGALGVTGTLARAPKGDERPNAALRRAFAGPLLFGMGLTALVAVTGAVAALGDTLFPARSLLEGVRNDLSPAAHLFVRLRTAHPFLALGSATVLVGLGMRLRARAEAVGAAEVQEASAWLLGFLVAQVSFGFLNLGLLAPIPMQIIHLLGADLVWLALVRLYALLRWPVALPSTTGAVVGAADTSARMDLATR